jgi:hypothetical protein
MISLKIPIIPCGSQVWELYSQTAKLLLGPGTGGAEGKGMMPLDSTCLAARWREDVPASSGLFLLLRQRYRIYVWILNADRGC